MDAVESCNFICDCRTFALNSYENRVYQVGIEDGDPLIVKFYRPARWSNEQIVELIGFWATRLTRSRTTPPVRYFRVAFA